MAKKAKDTSLSYEEKLEAFLVPEEEQPYELREGWRWVRVSGVSEFERGITFPASAKELELNENNIPCLRTANVQDDVDLDDLLYVDKSYMKGNEAKLVRKDDIIMSSANSRELVGKTSYVRDVPFPMTFGGFVLTIRAKEISSKYLFYFLRLQFLMGKFMGESTQTTNIANINTSTLGNYPIALPSLEEQEKIVSIIEHLFEKLDEAEEKIKNDLELFEEKRTAVTQKVLSGVYTDKWRKNSNVPNVEWEVCKLGDICDINPKKIDTKSLDDDLEVSFFPMPALSEIYGEITKPQTRRLGDVKKGFTNFSEGDVVFAKITPCMENGKSAVIGKLVNNIGFGTTEFFVLRCKNKLNNRFLFHVIRDKAFRDKAQAQMTGAVGQQRVPKSFLEEFSINLPSIEEQIEMARILDLTMEKFQAVREIEEDVLDQIALTKKAILGLAFKGELTSKMNFAGSVDELIKRLL